MEQLLYSTEINERNILFAVGVADEVDGATRALADLTDDAVFVLHLVVLRLHRRAVRRDVTTTL